MTENSEDLRALRVFAVNVTKEVLASLAVQTASADYRLPATLHGVVFHISVGHCEERALAGVSKDGHKRDRALRPSFETPAAPVIGPRYAPTRWRAPQDKVHR